MANFVVKTLPSGMGNSEEKKYYPKMQVSSELDFDYVVELISGFSHTFNTAAVRGVLSTLADVMEIYLPLGHSLKIDGIGTFTLSLKFADDKAKDSSQKDAHTGEEAAPDRKYRRVEARGVNFRVDKALVKAINNGGTFERKADIPAKVSPFTKEERLKRALQYIEENGCIALWQYASLNRLSRSAASRELATFVRDPSSGIAFVGRRTHKIWIARR